MVLRKATLLLAVVLASACAAPSDDDSESSAEALTAGRILVQGFGSPGSQVGKWGYDVKQAGKAASLKPALAREIFGDIGMNLLRIPVLAAEAHPSSGVDNIDASAYADTITAVQTAQAVRGSVDIFASVKLQGASSFPAWVKDGGEVSADPYSVLLENYLDFMNGNGVTVDWLGVDNESKFNEGNITPAKYNTIVANVKKWCGDHDIKVPGFIAPENYGPDEDLPWVEDLWQSNAQLAQVDHIGVHYYSKHRDADYASALQDLANNDHGKGLWDSELHWNDLNEDENVGFDDMKQGMLAAFDHFDSGFRAISWWAFQPRSKGTKSGYVMSELVSSTLGGNNLTTDDYDGPVVALNKFNTRAFKLSDTQVTLWVANFDNEDRKNQWAAIENQHVTAASFVQWSPSGPAAGKTGDASLTKDKSAFAMTYPANTMTRVTVTVK